MKFIKLYLFLSLFLINTKIGAQDFEVSPTILEFKVEPGQSQSIPISIINHSNMNNAFNIILMDFIINKEGRKIPMPAATTEYSLVNWLSVNPPFLELNPNESRQVIVNLQAPVGDYTSKWAYIYIRNTKEQTSLLADKKMQAGLNLQGQIIIQAIQSPSSNVNYKMKIAGLQEEISTIDSMRVFKAKVDNIGDKIAKCKVTLIATNIDTAKETILHEKKFKSFPGSEFDINLQFKKGVLQKGNYALAAILDYGKQSNLEGSQILIEVK